MLQDRVSQLALTEISGTAIQFVEEQLALELQLQPVSKCYPTALQLCRLYNHIGRVWVDAGACCTPACRACNFVLLIPDAVTQFKSNVVAVASQLSVAADRANGCPFLLGLVHPTGAEYYTYRVIAPVPTLDNGMFSLCKVK